MSNIILVDVGNTAIHFCQLKNNRLGRFWKRATVQTTQKTLSADLKRYPFKKILLCSVVPAITRLFKKLPYTVAVVGNDIAVPIRSYYNPREIGMDRLIAAFAARTLHPQTRMVLDCGTAITLDFISSAGAYQGGLILPGIGSTLAVLSSCALLPTKINVASHSRIPIIPRTTSESISKGVTAGFPCMLNTLIADYTKRLNISPTIPVVITGGDARHITSKLTFSYLHKEHLVLEGLARLLR